MLLVFIVMLFELALYMHVLWRARIPLAFSVVLCVAFTSGVLLVADFTLWSVLVAVLGAYRVGNMFRIIQARMHEGYLRRAAWRTSFMLIGLSIVFILCWFAWDTWHQTGHVVWGLAACVQLATAVVLYVSTARRLVRTAWPQRAKIVSDADLPTLTVAVPARNETDDLQACLESLVACDYPKLEILVLDDCSQTKRTPEIIRSFAHSGVRFIEGEEPKDTWLAKNQAYEHLFREANGEYILFCGVDVRFSPQSLRQLVSVTLDKRKNMVSLLPWRAASAERRFVVVQAMRYFWELVPPRRLFGRPPVLSTAWIAKKNALQEAGGFQAVARAIVPEAHFARTMLRSDRYSFMRANQGLGIESTKPAKEQYETAVRMRYPQQRRRPESVFLVSLSYAFGMLAPFCMVFAGFWLSIGIVAHVLSALTAILLTLIYLRVVVATRTGTCWVGLIALPYGMLSDIVLLHISMWQYEFSEVDWKGRNVCIPAMHVMPHLPPLDVQIAKR
jgi:cellulose synthase/poly-beta-1,6-N-acetylglucosamine synthase-like glycosyltransferase